jgi:hypothetical protein
MKEWEGWGKEMQSPCLVPTSLAMHYCLPGNDQPYLATMGEITRHKYETQDYKWSWCKVISVQFHL